MIRGVFGRRKAAADVPVLTEVLLTSEAMDDPGNSSVISININIINHFLTKFGYQVYELPAAAIESYSVDFYMSQVNNGGHEQFACNAAGRENSWKFARSGLEAMGASEHLAAFERFEAIIRRDDARARNLTKSGGFGPVDPEVEAIDDAFHAAETRTPLTALNGRWLRSRPNLFVLPTSELQKYIDNFRSHPGVAARMAQL